ncbi:MAG: hypothetical protein PHX39_05205 [Bacteroidales bacterium]|nr:hypothetical protein [Bacteroidales bacterium]
MRQGAGRGAQGAERASILYKAGISCEANCPLTIDDLPQYI